LNVTTTGGFLYGPAESVLQLTVRTRGGETRTAAMKRSAAYPQGAQPWRGGDVLKLLPGNIGYADLDRATEPMIRELFEKFAQTRAIIFDMRGHPKAPQALVATPLTSRAWTTVARFEDPLIDAPPGRASLSPVVTRTLPAMQPSEQGFGPGSRTPYTGKTVLLIDERTQSAAEHLGLFLEAANGTTFVGSPTAGANGYTVPFALPGGIRFSMSMQRAEYPDGRRLQRIGLVPDVAVKPTIKGLQDGRDEVLDAAVAYLDR
jgi:hypothetical protein